jgi:uncharacterized protein YrrD
VVSWPNDKEGFHKMRFRQNADVVTAQGEKVGEVDRVVLDPHTNAVTHVVVRQGLLFTEDKAVPVDLVASATEERVTLRPDAGDLEALPEFQEKHYVLVDERELSRTETASTQPTPVYWYPPLYSHTYGVPGPYAVARLPLSVQIERNVPEGTVALKEGAEVISADGEHVGDVKEVMTDPEADEVTHFVISQGLLFKDQKLIPYHWVSRLGEKSVHLAVGSEFIERLPAYTD